MGHDVCGFKDKEHENEIAYLRRGAFNGQARDIYKALNATEYDAGCSGCGETVFFTRQQLEEALAKLPAGEDHEQERQFVRNLLEKGEEAGAWIGFY